MKRTPAEEAELARLIKDQKREAGIDKKLVKDADKIKPIKRAASGIAEDIGDPNGEPAEPIEDDGDDEEVKPIRLKGRKP